MNRFVWAFVSSWVLIAAACAVDETSYLTPERIYYTAPTELSVDVDATVVLVGTPNAVRTSGGTLSVTTDNGSVLSELTVTNADGSFVTSFAATKGQKVRVEYDYKSKRATLDLALDDDLATVPKISVAPATGANTDDPPTPLFAANTDGTLRIAFGALEGAVAPIIAYNTRTLGSVVLEDTTPETVLPATAGDTICLFRIAAASAATSISLCDVVR